MMEAVIPRTVARLKLNCFSINDSPKFWRSIRIVPGFLLEHRGYEGANNLLRTRFGHPLYDARALNRQRSMTNDLSQFC